MPNDYSAFTGKGPTDGDVTELSRLIEAMRDAEIEVSKAEAELKARRDHLRKIEEVAIPELMHKMNVTEFTTASGLKVAVKRTVSAAPKVDDRPEAYDWLESNGHGGMVKRSVEVAFGVRQGEEATQLMEELSDKFPNVKFSRKVEPSTLRAWAKRQLDAGNNIPRELMNVRVFDKAKVSAVER